MVNRAGWSARNAAERTRHLCGEPRSSTNPVINLKYGSIAEFVGGPRHGQWLNAIKRIALGYEAQRVGAAVINLKHSPRSSRLTPFPFSPTFQNGARRPGFAKENLSNREKILLRRA